MLFVKRNSESRDLSKNLASLFFLHICKTLMRNPSKASNLLFPEKVEFFFTKHPPSDLRFFVLLCFLSPLFFLSFFFLRESIVSRTHRRLLLRSRGGVSLLFQSYFSPLFFTGKEERDHYRQMAPEKRDRISIRDYLSSPKKIREREVSGV